MTIETFDSNTTNQAARPRLRPGHRIRLAIAVLLAGIASVVTMSAASATAVNVATTSPTTYLGQSISCTGYNTGNAAWGLIMASPPVAALNYTGTTYLYWSSQVQVKLTNGQWAAMQSDAGFYAHIWGHQGTELTPIYWNDTSSLSSASYIEVPGYTYRVVGTTYWWNGNSWFNSSSVQIGGPCTF